MSSHGPSPFHTGEQQIQARLGVRDEIEPWARRVVKPFLPEQHRDFYGELPFVVAAARDDRGRPWATILAGAPGAFHSPDPCGTCLPHGGCASPVHHTGPLKECPQRKQWRPNVPSAQRITSAITSS